MKHTGMHPGSITSIMVCLFFCSASLIAGPSCENSGDTQESDQIRDQRIRFNRAIDEGESSVLQEILHENVVLITGTDSDIFEGREAQVSLWQDDFEKEKRAVYVRTSLCVRVSPILPIALEFGYWRGVFNHDPESFASGHYTAKWRKVNGAWLVESEVFATEGCGGSFCP